MWGRIPFWIISFPSAAEAVDCESIRCTWWIWNLDSCLRVVLWIKYQVLSVWSSSVESSRCIPLNIIHGQHIIKGFSALLYWRRRSDAWWDLQGDCWLLLLLLQSCTMAAPFAHDDICVKARDQIDYSIKITQEAAAEDKC